MIMDSEEWRTEALCAGTQSELSFSREDKWLEKVCLDCPVLGYCSQEVLNLRQQWKDKTTGQNNHSDGMANQMLTVGVWGGEYINESDYRNYGTQSGENASKATINRVKSSKDKWNRLKSRAANKEEIYKKRNAA